MNVTVLSTADVEAWRDAVERLPDSDAYDLVEYHRAAEANGDGVAGAFVVQEAGALFFHPFLRRPIDRVGTEAVDGGWCDLESVYGYSGPRSTGDDAFRGRCWRAFEEWCKAERVVAEFVRFNPLVRNERLAPPELQVVLDRETVAVPLDGSASGLWSSYRSAQRNMVRKAEAAGLTARQADPADHLHEFRAIYDETLERLDADASYAFAPGYFEALLRLGDQMRLFEVRRDDELAAAALFLVHGPRMHYHLAGSRAELRSFAPNNLLLHAAATWGLDNGATTLHLGGGRTPAPDDALLRFKSSLSRIRLPFYTGRRVHDPRMYETLCSSWLHQARPRVRPTYFLLYRLEPRA